MRTKRSGRWCWCPRSAAPAAGNGALLLMQIGRGVALHHRFGRHVGLLQVDAPVTQFLERDFSARHGTADERAGANDAKIAVEIFDLGLAWQGSRTIGAIEQMHLLWQPARSARHASQHNGRLAATKPSYF